jgi:hypothetical protein
MISIQIIIRRLALLPPTTLYYTNLSWKNVENGIIQVRQYTAQTAHQNQRDDDDESVRFDRIKQIAHSLRRKSVQDA